MEDIWSNVSDSLKDRVGQQNFDIWIKPIHFVSIDGEKVELEVPNRFFKEWINEHYSPQIREAVSFFTQKPCHLQFRIRNDRIGERDFIPPFHKAARLPPVLLFNRSSTPSIPSITLW